MLSIFTSFTYGINVFLFISWLKYRLEGSCCCYGMQSISVKYASSILSSSSIKSMDAKAAAAAETHFAPKLDSESPSSSMPRCLGFTVFRVDTLFFLSFL